MSRIKKVSHDTEMSLVDHLDELRYRLIVCFLAIAVTTVIIGLPLAKTFIEFLMRPLQKASMPEREKVIKIAVDPNGVLRLKDPVSFEEMTKYSHSRIDFEFAGVAEAAGPTVFKFGPRVQQEVYYSAPFDPFFLYIKAALILGITLAVPIWLWHLWAFVAPAFKPKEASVIKPVFWSALLLFPTGAAFAYFSLSFAFEMIFRSFYLPGLTPWLNAADYLSFVLVAMLILGLVFETPLVIILLVRMGVVSTKMLRSTRKYAILLIFVGAAIVTPPDPFTIFLMALPLCLLYEISIWISVIMERRIAKAEATAALEEKTPEEPTPED